MAVQRYGDGRSMIFAGEAAWRWRMMLPASDRSYDTFWRQAVRWLAIAAPDPVSLSVPAGASTGDVLALRIAVRSETFEPLRDATVDVRVTAPDGTLQELRATKEPGPGTDGRYVVALSRAISLASTASSLRPSLPARRTEADPPPQAYEARRRRFSSVAPTSR